MNNWRFNAAQGNGMFRNNTEYYRLNRFVLKTVCCKTR